MLFSSEKDEDSYSTFHYYYDGIFPTITIILDTEGRKFGGYTINNWLQPTEGEVYSRAVDSFIFNLSNKKKYKLIDNLDSNAIYKSNVSHLAIPIWQFPFGNFPFGNFPFGNFLFNNILKFK